ncbi:MAG: hypothetical protein LBM98_00175 [Oscillospiraceae bacterium]|nr:hypothetical protein [Oscillospiraceae bacterium]
MLRTCNWVRIAGVPVLRNDGLGRASPAFAPVSPCLLPAQCTDVSPVQTSRL